MRLDAQGDHEGVDPDGGGQPWVVERFCISVWVEAADKLSVR